MKKIFFIVVVFICAYSADCQTHAWFLAASLSQQNEVLLDGIAKSARAAYSLRRLRTAYTGPAIRIRRTDNSTETDIGFNALGDLDVSAITSFYSGECVVVTWYDQSGNGYHLTGNSTLPKISNPSINYLNSRPYMLFVTGSGTWSYFERSSVFPNPATEIYCFAPAYVTAVTPPDGMIFFAMMPDPNTNRVTMRIYDPANDGAYWDCGGYAGTNRIFTSNFHQLNTLYQFTATNSVTNNSQSIRKNGTSVISDASGHSVTTSFLRIGNLSNASLRGYFSEAVFFSQSLTSTEISYIERNQGAYYGITVN